MTAAGSATAFVLLVIAALHVVWMFSYWPFRGPAEFGSTIAGVGADELPSRTATGAVAVLLLIAACLVAARSGLLGTVVPHWIAAIGTWGVAAVLLARAVVGFAVFSRRTDAFGRMDLRVYSPLCLALACGCAATALG